MHVALERGTMTVDIFNLLQLHKVDLRLKTRYDRRHLLDTRNFVNLDYVRNAFKRRRSDESLLHSASCSSESAAIVPLLLNSGLDVNAQLS